jgi:hypothetical protein
MSHIRDPGTSVLNRRSSRPPRVRPGSNPSRKVAGGFALPHCTRQAKQPLLGQLKYTVNMLMFQQLTGATRQRSKTYVTTRGECPLTALRSGNPFPLAGKCFSLHLVSVISQRGACFSPETPLLTAKSGTVKQAKTLVSARCRRVRVVVGGVFSGSFAAIEDNSQQWSTLELLLRTLEHWYRCGFRLHD